MVAAVDTAAHGRGERKRGDEHRGGGAEHRRHKRHRTSPAPKEATKEPAPAVPSSSEDSSSSDSNDKTKKVVDKRPLEDENQEQVQIIASRVDDLTAKAMAFSRALARAQQALKTSARIAREAAVSFESELENFVAAQRDINQTFNIHT